ncbi:MAG: palindromic element RPE2 domain-containing protein [Rickettsia endosymbiont of Ixodes persulcatus]|nr:palindromic element RPE2 domain-containing protein [Rickettsia endosymbiont of Ixodes persulcatus]MCZ6903320.1 palindromic element RPE2 domain-containing protein [Rickettsia endosymbiont of Ixodes persulcatus]MCZ6909259.1 palindromic element RPE2 domain-containing protein [Rickettsia endosymbiont of Ixodes persulcatus]MCZ6910014.1 palindromic element RPE2 domain-containing protein [Rickettsia endosymbiont of Ixodes persulcatus]MCZ6913476.1 palindromic element RPE2 domain-containing protein [
MQKFDSLFKSKNICFIAIVIFVLSSFTLYHNAEILKFFKSDAKDLSQTFDTVEESKSNISEAKNEAPLLSTKSLLNYVSSLKFPEAPPEQKLETIVNSASFGYKEQGAKPITNRKVTNDTVGTFKSIDYTADTSKIYTLDYIHYLLSVNLLVYNFMQDKDYSKELRIVKSRLLPQDIRNILNNLEAYNNNYLFSKSSSTEVIFPTNHKWLEKFIKIEKKPSVMIIKEQDKNLILEKLNYLIDFLYSEKFMQAFVNKDV